MSKKLSEKSPEVIIKQIKTIEQEQKDIFWEDQNSSDSFTFFLGIGGIVVISISGLAGFTLGPSQIGSIGLVIGLGMVILSAVIMIKEDFIR